MILKVQHTEMSDESSPERILEIVWIGLEPVEF